MKSILDLFVPEEVRRIGEKWNYILSYTDPLVFTYIGKEDHGYIHTFGPESQRCYSQEPHWEMDGVYIHNEILVRTNST